VKKVTSVVTSVYSYNIDYYMRVAVIIAISICTCDEHDM